MKTTLNTKFETIANNSQTIKDLRLENETIIKDIIKIVSALVKEIKEDKLFVDASKKQIIDIIKVRNDIKGNSILGIVCDYVEMGLTIDYTLTSKALFIDLVKGVKSDIISKASLKKAVTTEDYKKLRSAYLETKKAK